MYLTAEEVMTPIGLFFNMLNTCIRFDLLETVLEVDLGYTQVVHKNAWSKDLWERAWRFDDIHWKSTTILHETNDLLINTVGKSQYLTWWYIADNTPHLQAVCEVMARLVCHASTCMLKDDDARYKMCSSNQRMCHECD